MNKIFDTSGLLHSSNLNFSGFITTSVFNEVIDENIKAVVKSALRNKKLKFLNPSDEYLKIVKNKVTETKDKLSKTDIDVLACALEHNLTIVSDDYGIQNVAKFLKIDYETIAQDGIEERVLWKKICTGCGKEYSGNEKTCDICGSKIKTKKVKAK